MLQSTICTSTSLDNPESKQDEDLRPPIGVEGTKSGLRLVTHLPRRIREPRMEYTKQLHQSLIFNVSISQPYIGTKKLH